MAFVPGTMIKNNKVVMAYSEEAAAEVDQEANSDTCRS
jgi:hypothetical protein